MADTPLFYLPLPLSGGQSLQLPEDTARHVGQVLRMEAGKEILLTDGIGLQATCSLKEVSKKRVHVVINKINHIDKPSPGLHLAIAFTRNASRNEWLLEKATELGVQQITPLVTARGLRERIRHDRWQAILVSAMLQSRQCWLPVLRQPRPFAEVIREEASQKIIAHCMDSEPRVPITEALKTGVNALIFIGPEGDFTPAEVTLAKDGGAIPVSLGANRLRTETAALSVITYYYLTNYAV